MARAHEIAIAADAKDFDRGIRDGVIKPLEKAEEALEDLADAADDAGREGSRGLDRLEDALKDAQRQSKKTEDSVDDIGEGGKRGFGKASEAATEFKQEALQNLSEVTSSFDGSMDSVTDLVQGTLGGIASSIPGIGLAGAAAAVGVGAIAGAFGASNQASQEAKARASEWAQAWVDSGGIALNAATKTATALDIITDPDRYSEATENAKNWGVDVGTAIAAMAGETWALDAAQSSLSDTSRRLADEMSQVGIQDQDLVDNMTELSTQTAAGQRSLDALNGAISSGKQQAADYSSYLRLMAENTEGAAVSVDEFGDSVYSLPDGVTVYIDAETGQATTDTAALEQKVYGIKDKNVNINAQVNGMNQVRVDLDALTRSRTVSITAKLNTQFAQSMGWDK